jgi:hypothetical protein
VLNTCKVANKLFMGPEKKILVLKTLQILRKKLNFPENRTTRGKTRLCEQSQKESIATGTGRRRTKTREEGKF